jgi:hypothetical protein
VAQHKSGIEIKVIDWADGNEREIAVHFLDLNQMITLSPEGARNFAFRLMECADFVEPPFTDSNPESEEMFGSYDEEEDPED